MDNLDNSYKVKRNTVFIIPPLLACAILIGSFIACENTDEIVVPTEPEWQSLHFDNKGASRLRLFKPHLYVCAGSNGLWRRDIQTEYSDWEYLGMSDTSFGNSLNGIVTDVIVNSENPDIMLVAFQPGKASDHGIFKTEDGGDTWFASDSGAAFVHPRLFLQTPYDLFAAGDRLLHTSNFGDSWEVIRQNGVSVGSSLTHDFRHHNKDTNRLWMGGVSVIETPDLFFSMDGGTTWYYVDLDTIATEGIAVYSIAFDPNDPYTVYVGLYSEIIKTSDGGASWIAPFFVHDKSVYCIVEDHTKSGHLFASVGKTTMKTEDGGVSWMDLQSPNDSEVLSMDYDSEDNALYIGTRYGPTASGVFVYK